MIHQKIKLSDTTQATMTTYILDDGEYGRKGLKKPAIVICPGGGYTMVSKNEGEPIALFFNRHGYHAFVIEYSVKINHPFPTALCELAKAMSIVNAKKEEWLIQDGISVAGFSAGGNLALSLGIYANQSVITSEIGLTYENIRPERIILGYPAVTLHPKYEGEGSELPDELTKLMDKGLMPDFRGPSIREILIGHENINEKDAESLNLLQYLHNDLPPIFIWGSYKDSIIPATDLTMLATRLYELDVPCELHMFGNGSHGLSLCDTSVKDEEEIQGLSMNYWTILCLKWLNQK